MQTGSELSRGEDLNDYRASARSVQDRMWDVVLCLL